MINALGTTHSKHFNPWLAVISRGEQIKIIKAKSEANSVYQCLIRPNKLET